MSSLGPGPDHYRTLGVVPGSSTDVMRRAYRELARELHPDRHLQSSPQEAGRAAERMREVNAAWAVLSNPGARELYDLERRLAAGRDGQAGSSVAGASSAHAGPARSGPPPARITFDPRDSDVGHPIIRGLLWIVILGVLAAIFVFTAYAANSSNQPPSTVTSTTTALLLGPGDCVAQAPGAVDVVPCSGPHDAIVDRLVPLGRPCPAGTREIYLPDQQESACLASA
ncbi:MAG: J domain-containing protein [Acidimicrobiales bacterium]